MTRETFIRSFLLAGAGIGILPQLSFGLSAQDYTLEQLIGKNNPDISGDTYTSTMHRETKIALQKMRTAAAADGITIEVVSAFRSFDRQREIFENKYRTFTGNGLAPMDALAKIIEYSTIPGTSRHHWGTDLDLIDASAPRPQNVLQERHFHGNGPYCKLREWLNSRASQYGFYEVYTDRPGRKGFKYEPWHYSFAPVSVPMLKAYRGIDVKKVLQQQAILGSEYFTDPFISRYIEENILDINPILL